MIRTYRPDMENNAEDWWDAFRAAYPLLQSSDPELYGACLRLDDYSGNGVTLHDPALVERFDAFVSGLPGYATGPAHARGALIADEE